MDGRDEGLIGFQGLSRDGWERSTEGAVIDTHIGRIRDIVFELWEAPWATCT
jgi:hypothetical protein